MTASWTAADEAPAATISTGAGQPREGVGVMDIRRTPIGETPSDWISGVVEVGNGSGKRQAQLLNLREVPIGLQGPRRGRKSLEIQQHVRVCCE